MTIPILLRGFHFLRISVGLKYTNFDSESQTNSIQMTHNRQDHPFNILYRDLFMRRFCSAKKHHSLHKVFFWHRSNAMWWWMVLSMAGKNGSNDCPEGLWIASHWVCCSMAWLSLSRFCLIWLVYLCTFLASIPTLFCLENQGACSHLASIESIRLYLYLGFIQFDQVRVY